LAALMMDDMAVLEMEHDNAARQRHHLQQLRRRRAKRQERQNREGLRDSDCRSGHDNYVL
jgi:hypothetical protein